jgi:hypothetical protein
MTAQRGNDHRLTPTIGNDLFPRPYFAVLKTVNYFPAFVIMFFGLVMLWPCPRKYNLVHIRIVPQITRFVYIMREKNNAIKIVGHSYEKLI